jgi:hypothetical protein
MNIGVIKNENAAKNWVTKNWTADVWLKLKKKKHYLYVHSETPINCTKFCISLNHGNYETILM